MRRLIGQFRHSLEDVVLQRVGEVSLYSGALIQSACRHEGRAQLLQRWLRELDKGDKSPSIHDKLAILKEIGAASDARDRCLKQLGLHEKPQEDDGWPTITVTSAQESSATGTDGDDDTG